MKTHILLATIILAVSSSKATADYIPATTSVYDARSGLPNIPPKAWEPHKEGVALFLTLTGKTEQNKSYNVLTIYINNTSNTLKTCFISPSHREFQILTLNDSGTWHPLYPYNAGIYIHMPTPISINPGQTLVHAIELAPDQLTLVASRRVKCHIEVVDETLKKRFFIESSPEQLIETK